MGKSKFLDYVGLGYLIGKIKEKIAKVENRLGDVADTAGSVSNEVSGLRKKAGDDLKNARLVLSIRDNDTSLDLFDTPEDYDDGVYYFTKATGRGYFVRVEDGMVDATGKDLVGSYNRLSGTKVVGDSGNLYFGDYGNAYVLKYNGYDGDSELQPIAGECHLTQEVDTREREIERVDEKIDGVMNTLNTGILPSLLENVRATEYARGVTGVVKDLDDLALQTEWGIYYVESEGCFYDGLQSDPQVSEVTMFNIKVGGKWEARKLTIFTSKTDGHSKFYIDQDNTVRWIAEKRDWYFVLNPRGWNVYGYTGDKTDDWYYLPCGVGNLNGKTKELPNDKMRIGDRCVFCDGRGLPLKREGAIVGIEDNSIGISYISEIGGEADVNYGVVCLLSRYNGIITSSPVPLAEDCSSWKEDTLRGEMKEIFSRLDALEAKG